MFVDKVSAGYVSLTDDPETELILRLSEETFFFMSREKAREIISALEAAIEKAQAVS